MPDSFTHSSIITLIGVVITALLSAFGGVAVARRKGESDDASSIATLRIAGLEHHDKIIERQQKEIDRQEKLIQKLIGQVDSLQRQVAQLEKEQ